MPIMWKKITFGDKQYIIIHREKRKIHLYIVTLYKKANQSQKHLRTVKI